MSDCSTSAKIDNFWNWFKDNEQKFFEVVKNQDDIPENFFSHIEPHIKDINEGFFFLTGMYKDDVAELIITPDGAIKNIVFVEEMIAQAPELPNWKFTALKTATEGIGLQMYDYTFDKDTLSFYATEDAYCPDNIDITIVYEDFPEEDRDQVMNGIYIFLDNYLGELNFITMIDNLEVKTRKEAEQELIPIEKLKSYLIWREKEFVEKYEAVRHSTEGDSFSNLKAELPDGKPLFAIVDNTLLNWDRKASHPWICEFIIDYACDHESGLPDKETDILMNEIQDEIDDRLKDIDGNLFVVRETCDAQRCLFYACSDFRSPSKVLSDIEEKYNQKYEGTLEISYSIYKDKYWHSFERYRQ